MQIMHARQVIKPTLIFPEVYETGTKYIKNGSNCIGFSNNSMREGVCTSKSYTITGVTWTKV